MKTKTCGREPTCDLALEHPTVSRLHARVMLADDGLVSIRDEDSQNGTFLHRNDGWIQVRKVILCIGDRIRFGDIEVSSEQLTAVFGNRSNARLEAKHLPPRTGSAGTRKPGGQTDNGPALQKPRRNPATGKIEEEHPARDLNETQP